MPRFGNKDKDTARKEELDRQAAEEVERLTRRGGPPSMGGGGPNIGRVGIPSPLERIADEMRGAPRPVMRRAAPAKKAAPQPQAFTAMPSGSVGSSFGPGGLNPGPRTGVTAPPPSAFGGSGYDEDYGGAVTGPPVYYAGEPDEDEEMSITELALMDHAAHTGHDPEDLVISYDAGTAEQMRDNAMRQFYERQASRGQGAQTNNPFAPAGMRRGPVGSAPAARRDDPAAAGDALAQRLANRRRGGATLARQPDPAPAPPSSRPAAAPRASAPPPRPEPATDEGALARVLARRRQSLGIDAEPEPAPAPTGRRHAEQREDTSPGRRVVPIRPVDDEPAPARRSTAKPAPAAKAAGPAKATKAAKAAKAAPATKAKKAPAPTARTAAAKKALAAKKAPAAKTVFCIECGEKNPGIAKFCFNCGTRLANPEG